MDEFSLAKIVDAFILFLNCLHPSLHKSYVLHEIFLQASVMAIFILLQCQGIEEEIQPFDKTPTIFSFLISTERWVVFERIPRG